jgi:uncharacterized protein (DUF58 family)
VKSVLQRWRQWLSGLLTPRKADTPPLRLTQRRIYVLPTTAGMLYASTLLLMLVGSINYNLSLGYALTFLLAGLGIVAIVQSFRNLSGLQLAPARHAPGFAGEQIHFGVRLDTQRPRAGLQLQLLGGTPGISHVYEQDTVQLALPAAVRGWQSMPRLTIASSWPLGLVKAWSHARFQERCLVYPAPANNAPAYPASGGEGRRPNPDEPDDFFGLRPHRITDLPQHVAWKASARLDEQLLSKQFAAEQGEALWFDLAQAPGQSLEEKLGVLTRWVLDAHAARQSYGLRLGGLRVTPAASTEHLHACLQALALYG